MSDRRRGAALAVNTAWKQRSEAIEPFAFKPGQSGNPRGRPKGSRNKLSEDFIATLYDSWQSHGPTAIARVAKHRPHEYLKIVAGLVPRNFGLEKKDPLEELSDEELKESLAMVRQMIAAAKAN